MEAEGDWEKMESWNLHSFIDVTVPIYTDTQRAIARCGRGGIDQRGGYERHDGYVQDQQRNKQLGAMFQATAPACGRGMGESGEWDCHVLKTYFFFFFLEVSEGWGNNVKLVA